MTIRRCLRIFKSIYLILTFLIRNLWQAKTIPVIPKGKAEDVEFLPCTKDLAPCMVSLYPEFHQGNELGIAKRAMLPLAGKKLCLVVEDAIDKRVVGYSLYYFNHRDVKEKTVHEGDTGILPEYQGRGIGTALRLHALRHFARSQTINGVSSRVSLNNLASLKSNINLGFKEQERYYDPVMEEERVYLVCDLSPYRQNPTAQEIAIPNVKGERITKNDA